MLKADRAFNASHARMQGDAGIISGGNIYTTWAPKLLGVLRIILGFLLIPHGLQKLFGLGLLVSGIVLLRPA